VNSVELQLMKMYAATVVIFFTFVLNWQLLGFYFNGLTVILVVRVCCDAVFRFIRRILSLCCMMHLFASE